jgi:hypothetical protein
MSEVYSECGFNIGGTNIELRYLVVHLSAPTKTLHCANITDPSVFILKIFTSQPPQFGFISNESPIVLHRRRIKLPPILRLVNYPQTIYQHFRT